MSLQTHVYERPCFYIGAGFFVFFWILDKSPLVSRVYKYMHLSGNSYNWTIAQIVLYDRIIRTEYKNSKPCFFLYSSVGKSVFL